MRVNAVNYLNKFDEKVLKDLHIINLLYIFVSTKKGGVKMK